MYWFHNRIYSCLLIIFIIFIVGIKAAAWEQTGTASWYGGDFQGRLTANGEVYNTYGMTCAHKMLPFGTVLEVTNISNGKTVKVRVNDRGPFASNRIIDLTYAAAEELDMIQDGTALVRISAPDQFIPKVRFKIQIGAWGKPENVIPHRDRLKKAGFKPATTLTNTGITRLILNEVSNENIFSTVQNLESLGYTDLFIYQLSNTDIETQR